MIEDKTGFSEQSFPIKNTEALDSLSIVLGETANDFNNILSIIFGYVEMALSEIPEGTRARSDLEHVLAAGDRAKELIAKVLTFSNDNKLKKSEIEINNTLVRAINSFKDRLPAHVTFNSYITDEPALVYGNYTEIFQVMSNLLTNSLQAIGKNKGEITVSSKLSEKTYASDENNTVSQQIYIITVSDNGCGMDLDTLSRVYSPFFSKNNGFENLPKKAGLGLTTAYNIIKNMQGEIQAQSQIDKGTTFTLTLPSLPPETKSKRESKYSLQSHRQKSLLYIDDEEAITSMARQILEKNNYKITTFNDANAALDHFRENPDIYDVVITDLVMPGISGTDVALRLNSLRPSMPIILTTGFSENISSSSCHKWGIQLVMHKPFSINDILSAIESVNPA